jgi:hypothetical protein
MPEPSSIADERTKLTGLNDDVLAFFAAVEEQNKPQAQAGEAPNGEDVEYFEYGGDDPSPALTKEGNETADTLARRIRHQMVQISTIAKGAALLGEEDRRDLSHFTKTMAAAVRFRRYTYQDLYVHHDEGTVLGVTPASQSDHQKVSLRKARTLFLDAYKRVSDLTELISSGENNPLPSADKGTSTYKPDTAFIMMQIDKDKPDLDDVNEAVKTVFERFGINALRADEIQHDDAFVDRIIAEISSREFLFADLTGERPSVYYEVGYAHALKKRVILVRKKGTRIHADLAHRNCPDYDNLVGLKSLLHKRLVAMTGKNIPEKE